MIRKLGRICPLHVEKMYVCMHVCALILYAIYILWGYICIFLYVFIYRFLNVFIHEYIYKCIENLCNNASESWKNCWLQRGDYIAQRQWMRYLLMLVCHFVFFAFCAIVRHYLSKQSKRKDNLECWRVNRKSVERSEHLLITWVQADGEGSCNEQYSKFRNSVLFPPKAEEQWDRKPEKVRQTWHVQKSVSSWKVIFVWGEDYHTTQFFFFCKTSSGWFYWYVN